MVRIAPAYVTGATTPLPLPADWANEPDARLTAELELVSFVKDRETWEMNFDEKVGAI